MTYFSGDSVPNTLPEVAERVGIPLLVTSNRDCRVMGMVGPGFAHHSGRCCPIESFGFALLWNDDDRLGGIVVGDIDLHEV